MKNANWEIFPGKFIFSFPCPISTTLLLRSPKEYLRQCSCWWKDSKNLRKLFAATEKQKRKGFSARLWRVFNYFQLSIFPLAAPRRNDENKVEFLRSFSGQFSSILLKVQHLKLGNYPITHFWHNLMQCCDIFGSNFCCSLRLAENFHTSTAQNYERRRRQRWLCSTTPPTLAAFTSEEGNSSRYISKTKACAVEEFRIVTTHSVTISFIILSSILSSFAHCRTLSTQMTNATDTWFMTSENTIPETKKGKYTRVRINRKRRVRSGLQIDYCGWFRSVFSTCIGLTLQWQLGSGTHFHLQLQPTLCVCDTNVHFRLRQINFISTFL